MAGNSEIDAEVGKALHRLRHERSMTVTELATQAQVSVAMISRIENGNVSPSLNTLQSLAQALSVSIMALFQTRKNRLMFTMFELVLACHHGGLLMTTHMTICCWANTSGLGAAFNLRAFKLNETLLEPYRSTNTKGMCLSTSLKARPSIRAKMKHLKCSQATR